MGIYCDGSQQDKDDGHINALADPERALRSIQYSHSQTSPSHRLARERVHDSHATHVPISSAGTTDCVKAE